MATKQATKYRPVLTAAQIQHIILLAKTEVPISNASISLLSTLAPFQAKIENAAITPAYTTTPRVSTTSLEALGAPATPSSNNQAACLTKEEVWELAYHKYQANPASCTVQEIRDSQEYAYLNDLMTPAQLAAFEADNF